MPEVAKTIRDIAKEAGVSVSTVSLAVNNDARVKPDTRARIMKIAEQHGYRPTFAARSLSSGRSWILNVINPAVNSALTSGFNTRFLHGVHDVARQGRYTVSVTVVEDEQEAIDSLEVLALERATDGVILMNPSESVAVIQKLRQRAVPHTMLGRAAISGVCSVDNDNVAVGRDATRHLIDTGKSPCMFLSGPRTHTVSQDRFKGFREAHEATGTFLDESLVRCGAKTAEQACADVIEVIDSGVRFASVLALSDALAIGAMRAVRSRGLCVPNDVAIMGMNNDDVTAFTDPPMSSVELNAFELGKASARLLIAQIENEEEELENEVVSHKLIIRETTRGEDSADRLGHGNDAETEE